MKRTTLALDPLVQRRLKEKAAREGRTLQDVANEMLRQGLSRPAPAESYKLELEGWRAQQLPGVDVLDRDQLFDLMAGGS